MSIELTVQQAHALQAVVRTRLGSLSSEIRHTDSPRVRQELRDERDALRVVAESLLVPAA